MTGAKPGAARVAALRQRRAALGLVRVEVYVRPQDAERVKRYAARLTRHLTPATEPL
jgi:hypothetical protein